MWREKHTIPEAMERKHAESDRPEEPLGRLLLFWNILPPLFLFLLYWPCGASLLGNEIFIISFHNIPCFWIVERSQNIYFFLLSLPQPKSLGAASPHLHPLTPISAVWDVTRRCMVKHEKQSVCWSKLEWLPVKRVCVTLCRAPLWLKESAIFVHLWVV